MKAYLRLAALAVLSPAAIIANVGETQLGAHRFTLPEGFEIELVAGPPLVDRPIAAAFDEQGRLYVSDSSGSNDKTEQQLIERPHRIMRLEDSDGDGRFDRSVVFADKMMFPEGVMWLDGSLYVGAPPSIWKLTDTDGDGIADQRVEWFQGKTLTGCANDLHGPYPGPDGLIYWCKGAFAEQTHTLANGRTITDRAAHIFRCLPDGSQLESVMSGGMDNPVDIAFTREGEPIFTSTFLDLSGDGKRDGLGHAVWGGVFPKVNDVTEPLTRTGALLPAMTHFGPGAPCGFTRVESAALGEEYRDNFFACLFNLHKVTRHILEPAGATYRTRDSDFLISDNTDFHPTDVIEDPDGSLLIIDTGGWYKLCCPTSQLAKPDVLGAIYRVRRKGAPVARASTDAAARQNVLWKLAGTDAREKIRAALADPDAAVQQTAAKICALHRDEAATDSLVGLLKSDAPQLRRVVAEALGRIGNARAVPALLAASATVGDDRFLEHSLIYALIEIADATATAEGLRAEQPAPMQRAALIALSEMNALSANRVLPLLSAKDDALRETAFWVASRHADWGGELAGYFEERLKKIPLGERTDLENLLARMSSAPAIQQLIARLLRPGGGVYPVPLLSVIARSQLKQFPADWIDVVDGILARGRVTRPDIDAARTLAAHKEGAKLAGGLLAVANNRDNSPEIRLAAAAAVPTGTAIKDAELFAFLRSKLDDSGMRADAAAALSRLRLDETQCAALLDALPELGPLELSRVLSLFDRKLSEPATRVLLETLRRAPAIAASQPQAVRAIVGKFPAGLAPDGTALLASLNLDPVQQRAKLDAIAAELPAGDVRRGQLVFNSPKSTCTTCHAVGYLGGRFGPDLTSIGQARSERDLLEAVVFPSASFVRSYEPMMVRTRSGVEMTGLIRSETGDAVTLGLAPRVDQAIPRAEIAEMHPGPTSLMPQGFDQMLTRQELSDLIAFLKASVRTPH